MTGLTTYNGNLPALGDSGLSQYLAEVKRYPFLTHEEETEYATEFQNSGDMQAAHKLVTSHLRLVVKIAMGMKGYGLPIADLIAEGNVGLMQAVKKFDASTGNRFSTYAMWWIKATMHEYILRSWSIVKTGSSAGQKKLFFNLRRLKNQIAGEDENQLRALRPDEVTEIAKTLNVKEDDVIAMDSRIYGGDTSLNKRISYDGEGAEIGDLLSDERPTQEVIAIEESDYDYKKRIFMEALKSLNLREQEVLTKRKLLEPPKTLEDLSQEYGVSRERVRQIEGKAMQKLQEFVQQNIE